MRVMKDGYLVSQVHALIQFRPQGQQQLHAEMSVWNDSEQVVNFITLVQKLEK